MRHGPEMLESMSRLVSSALGGPPAAAATATAGPCGSDGGEQAALKSSHRSDSVVCFTS